MKILRLDIEHRRLALKTPYTIAYERIDHAPVVFVRVVTDGPHIGLGCAVPDEEVTGELLDGTAEALAGLDLAGADPLCRSQIVERVREELPNRPSARAAIDIALLDLLGRVSGLPAWRLLGAHRPAMATSVTIGVLSEAETLAEARAYADQGFTILKLKGGLDPDDDAARVRAVHAALPHLRLRFDANQGYDVAAATRFAEALGETPIECLEQPTARDELTALKQVTAALPLRVMADESVLTLADAFHLSRHDAMDLVNIKLMKVGGIEDALQVNAVARAAGVEVMVGCMDEPALSIAAGLAFALARPNVEMADLDGHLELASDPTAACVRLKDGVLYPSDLPGLGLPDLT